MHLNGQMEQKIYREKKRNKNKTGNMRERKETCSYVGIEKRYKVMNR